MIIYVVATPRQPIDHGLTDGWALESIARTEIAAAAAFAEEYRYASRQHYAPHPFKLKRAP